MLRNILLIILLNFSLACWGDTPLIVGVAEEKRVYDRTPVVRALFKKHGDSWLPINNRSVFQEAGLEKNINWNLVFDGKNAGSIVSIDPIESNISSFVRDKYLSIENEEHFPKLGNKEKRFWNWGGLPENRPIAVNTYPYYEDKEQWKRIRGPKDLLDLRKKVFSTLHPLVGDAFHCNGAPKWDWDEIEFKLEASEVFKAYGNKSGSYIVSAGLALKHRSECDGVLDKSKYPIWFYINREVKLIGYELDLVEAADFDNDGRVEFIFQHSGYNEDGYTLFESEFESRFDYYWKYH